ncbi:MAG: TolC family protein [Thermoanaerobaculia bacterium]
MRTRTRLYVLLVAAFAVLGAGVSAGRISAGTIDGEKNPEGVEENGSASAKTSADLSYAPGAAPADRILATISDVTLRALIADVLARNPEIAATKARAESIEQRAPQVRALPDPVAGVTAFVLTPETRVGSQEASAGIAQKFPWFGKLKLKERAALFAAAAARADVETLRLKLVTEVRRLYYELGFLDALDEVIRTDRATLSHYEELAEARYRSGVGHQQPVIKIQAEITKASTKLLKVADRRAVIVASLNALRDYPQMTAISKTELPTLPEIVTDLERLRAQALASRPEIAMSDAQIARSTALVDLAGKSYKPDVTAGIFYTAVGSRDDPAGRLNPPPDNGDDIFGISAGINLPIWRKKLDAGVEEAVKTELAAQESKRSVVAKIDSSLGELPPRIDLTWQQLRLFEDVLVVQAEQSLLSAEAGYSAGSQDALDLLDAERVLLDVRTGTERNRADYAIALAQLEGSVGGSLNQTLSSGEQE